MLEFRTLGTIDLRGEDGRRIESVLLHAKRLAILAYLSTSHPPRIHRRDTLLALFWPELDTAHARGALRQELSRLRRALGPGVIMGDGREAVGVDGERLWCDAEAFEAAVQSGQLSTALRVWGGEFLPGLHVDGGEFERWLDEARDSLGRHAIDSARRLMTGAEQAGDLAGAVGWARRLTELAPFDETAWQQLLSLLDVTGDRAGALTAYEALAARLRDQLEVEPSPETRALVERIRARVDAFGSTPSATIPPVPLALQNQVEPEPGGGPAGPSIPAAIAAPPPIDPPVSMRPRRLSWPLAGSVLRAAAAGLARVLVAGRPRRVILPPSVVAIQLLPVENETGDPGLDALARQLTGRLEEWISELHFVHFMVGPKVSGVVARVSATLYRNGELVEARARLVETGAGGRIIDVSEPLLLGRDSRDPSLDTLVARVVAAVAAEHDPRTAAPGRPAPFRVPSWEAYLVYLQGSELFGEFRYPESAELLYRAHEMDGSFVKAAEFSAIALAFAGQPGAAETRLQAVLAAGEPLPDYERFFGQWILADLRGLRPDAYQAAKEVNRVTQHPLLQFIAANEAMKLNRPRETVQLIESVPYWGLGWWRHYRPFMVEVYGGACHVLGAHRKELSVVRAMRDSAPGAFGLIRAEVRARVGLGQAERVLELVDEAQNFPPALTAGTPPTMTTPADIAWTAAQELDFHGHPQAAATARRVGLNWLLVRRDASKADRLLEAQLLLETGDVLDAQSVLAGLAPHEDLASRGLAGLLAATCGDTAGARSVAAQLEAIEYPYLGGQHLLLAAGVRAALSQPDPAMATLRRALAAGLPFSVELHALSMLRPLVGRDDFATLLRPRG
jgi:DNA-binding SARP family transcriptional activator